MGSTALAFPGTEGDRARAAESPARYPTTAGAAPGYVADEVCGRCHADLYRSFQEVGMARSFFRPGSRPAIEDFDRNRYVHDPSDRRYQMLEKDGELVFRRYELDSNRRPIHVFERRVDWILGSGSHARTYLYQTDAGEMYQLPIAWYTATSSWGMAPGFDGPDHEGVTRRVRRECMFCHNAYPEVSAGEDRYGAAHVFPHDLPEGIGCQRCHGPGAEHARLAARAEASFEEISDSILDPGELPPALRRDVCYQCHMQPSVALNGVRRFGRGDYSYRPGEPLAEYLVEVDVVEEGEEPGERFEINHHAYRLEQSRCFEVSNGALDCLTCHDPHRKVPEAARAAHYRAACLSCHELDDCGRDMHGGVSSPGDCVSCHMPKHRPRDVVHTVMTDHLIRRRPGGPELLAPLAETVPVIIDVTFLDPASAPEGALGEVYRAVSVLRAGGGEETLDHLTGALERAKPAELDPYFDLARGQLRRGRFAAARETLESILERSPGNPLAREWLAIALVRLKLDERALEILEKLAAERPERPETRYNLGLLLARAGRFDEAARELERAVALRPNLVAAWHYLGRVRHAADDATGAVADLRRALEVDPAHTDSYLALAEALVAAGERAEALRYLRHGERAAADPERVTAALAAFRGPAAAGRE